MISKRTGIAKDTFLPMHIEYTDDTGTVYRRLEVLAFEVIGGFATTTSGQRPNNDDSAPRRWMRVFPPTAIGSGPTSIRAPS